jgi:hypothetical protein
MAIALGPVTFSKLSKPFSSSIWIKSGIVPLEKYKSKLDIMGYQSLFQ